MRTAEEVAAIPLFADLPAAELERLARTSADLQLSAGEFAVHEGGEGALFVVISGKIEVVKTFDGVQRTLGWRMPGTIFGEVPLSLGSPFPGGYRAAETSRVMRIEVQQYYAVASISKEVAQKVNAIARERLGGLQAIATEPHKSRVTLVGHRWDTACSELRRFLARNQISFDWVTPDTPAAAAILDASRPAIDGPVARLADGAIIEKPDVRDLANRLELQTSPLQDQYDVAIVGGGPAGLAAAVYGASEGLRTIVVEREAPGGQAGTSSRIENYLGFPSGTSGDELASRALHQARRLGAEILVTRSVVGVDPARHLVSLDGGDIVSANSLILATGVASRHDCGGLFIFIGADAETAWLPKEIVCNERGYVLTGDDVRKAGRWSEGRDPYLLETSAPGVFACGDVRLSPVKRVASAVGEGSMAIAFVHQCMAQAKA